MMNHPILSQCPACAAPWQGKGRHGVRDFDAQEAMAQHPRLKQLTELSYQRCSRCGTLVAVDSRRDEELLASAYRQLPASYWTALSEQSRFAPRLARELDRRAGGGELWDVGCGSGGLLEQLPEDWRKHGIEPGKQAVATARAKGLDVRPGTAAGLGLQAVADVCLLIDTAEHLLDPETEARALFEMLRPGGLLAVFTGRASSPFARLAGARWYYLHCIGHVTIFSERGLQSLLARVGFTDIEIIPAAHDASVPWHRWIQRFVINAIKRLLGRAPGTMPYFQDHQLVFARRPAPSS